MPAPRKPTAVLELSGAFDKNPQRREERGQEPYIPGGLTEPPQWLDERAKAEWERIVPDLEAAGITSRIEATALATYCQAVSHMIAAESEIARDGICIVSGQFLRRHPALGIVKDCAGIIRTFANEFGMTPAARSKVHAKELPDHLNDSHRFEPAGFYEKVENSVSFRARRPFGVGSRPGSLFDGPRGARLRCGVTQTLRGRSAG